MGKGRRRVKPLVPPGKAPSQAAAPVTSLKLARKLTSKFHALLNEETALKGDRAAAPAAKAARLRQIQAEMDAMGGRAAYQEASALSTKAFRSSRYVYRTLTRLGLQPARGQAPLDVLEVGAVNGQLAVCPWMRVRAVDLRSRDGHVEECDFFDIPVAGAGASGGGPQPGGVPSYDVLVNAMVVNCVPDPVKRGEMLVRCRDHLVPGGLLFLAVPSRCIDMSRHVSRALLEGLLAALGFATLDVKKTPKISFYALRKEGGGGASAAAAAAGTAPPSRKRKRGENGGEEEGAAASSSSSSSSAAAAAAPALAAGVPRPKVPHAQQAWRPSISVAAGSAAAVTLARLAPPVRDLSRGELPVTGFTLTDFAVVIPTEWVRTVKAPAGGGSGGGGAAKPAAAVAVAAVKPPAAAPSAASAKKPQPAPQQPGGGGGGKKAKHAGGSSAAAPAAAVDDFEAAYFARRAAATTAAAAKRAT